MADKNIFHPQNRNELNAYTNNLVRKICSTYGLKYVDVIRTVYDMAPCKTPNQKVKTKNKDALELIVLHGKKYLYCHRTKLVYSYEVNPVLLGRLDKTHNLISVTIEE